MKGKHFAVIAFLTILTFSFVWVRLQIVSISYDINELTKKEHAIRDECNALTLRVNEAKSPHRLEHIAATKFKMYAPKAEQWIVLH